MNLKNLILFFSFLPLAAFSQEKSGYFINWDINHAETYVKPGIPLSKEEARTINCYFVEFDDKNRMTNVRYYFSGKPSNYGNYGAFELVREYHDDYFIEKYKNTSGAYVENLSKISKRKYYLDSEGYWIKKENYLNGNLLAEGVAVSKVTRNAQHQIESEIQFSAQEDTIPDGNGFTIVHFTYNKDNLALLRQNRNQAGKVINGTKGYATVVFQFDENGMFFEEQFLDEYNNLFLHPGFDLAKINWRAFDKYGKPARIYYMDEMGYPHKNRAYCDIKYRPNLTRESITYFDRNGEKTEDRNGVARSVYNYDSEGKYLGKTNFNLAGEQVE